MDAHWAMILEDRLYKAESLLACILHELEEEDTFLSHEIRDGLEQYANDYELDWEEVYSDFAKMVGLD